MTGTKDDRDMTGVLYGGVREKRAGKHIITTTHNLQLSSEDFYFSIIH